MDTLETPTFEHQLLPLNTIAPSRTEVQALRRARYSPTAMLELAASIAASDVIQPIVVRRRNIDGRLYEIVAGERRFIASDRVSKTHIPAVIRDIDDRTALEMQLSENSQREDAHPLEEGAGYRELIKLANITEVQIAERMGKSRSYVRSRIRLLDLEAGPREALQQGRIDASTALVIARLMPKQQDKALLIAGNGWPYKRFVEAVREKLAIKLDEAPWDHADEKLLTGGVACTACPLSSYTDADLVDPDRPSVHICTDGACFKAKGKAFDARARAAVIAAGGEILSGDEALKIAPTKTALVGYVDLDELCGDDECPAEYPDRSDYETQAAFDEAWALYQKERIAFKQRTYRQLLADALAAGTVTVTHVDDPHSRRMRHLVPVAEARKAIKAAHDIQLARSVGAKPEPAPARKPQVDFVEEQRKQEERQQLERDYRYAVLDAIAAKCKGALKREDLIELLQGLRDEVTAVARRVEAATGKAPNISAMSEAELGGIVRLCMLVNECRWVHDAPRALLAAAKRWRVDPAKIRKGMEAEVRNKTKATATPEKPVSRAPRAAAKPAVKKKATKK